MKRLPWTLVALACASPQVDSVPVQSQGTRRMAARLEAIRQGQSPERNPFRNGERAARLERLPIPLSSGPRRQHLFALGRELLWAGRTRESIALLEPLVAEVEAAGREKAALGLRRWLAMAYLRLGEQQNCVDGHSADSCVLPIGEAGRHRLEEGSRRALEQYRRVLASEPLDLESRWLYNLAAMTLGLYPDAIDPGLVVETHKAEAGASSPRFRDVATGMGLDSMGLAGGSVVEDLDGDGLPDVMVSSWGLEDPLTVLINRGGSFVDRSVEAGLSGIEGGLNLVPADYDNDGDVDVLVLRGAWLGPYGHYPNSLLRNEGNARFADVTEEAGLLDFLPSQTAAWADYDTDGHLDLFVGVETTTPGGPACKLFHNRGDGTFEDVSAAEGAAVVGFVKGVTWGDYDNDGQPDLYISRLDGENILLRNRGEAPGPRFEDVTQSAGVGGPISSFPTWFFDYDNDGWLDLFVAGYPGDYLSSSIEPEIEELLGAGATTSVPRLYRNRGDGSFADVTRASGLEHVLIVMGSNFGDLDNDGWLDFYLGTGAPALGSLTPNRAFRNLGGERFQDVTEISGLGHLQKGHGVSFVDIDGDGDQDVFTVIGGAFSGDESANVLFENPGNDNSWMTLRLHGTKANRSAVGARVELVLETPHGRRELYRTVGTGGSFGANSLQLEVGLGDATWVRRIEVEWPGDGRRQSLERLVVNQVIEIEQGDPQPEFRRIGPDREVRSRATGPPLGPGRG